MSKKYREKFGIADIDDLSKATGASIEELRQALRKFHQRPGRVDENGEIEYTTEQDHKKECDVNEIIKKYDKRGVITHISKIEAKFGDMTGADFQAMQNQVILAKNMFNALPAEIRKEFDNNPSSLLEFMEDPNNRDRAIELGLIDAQWTPETDGLGEHVKEGENIKEGENPPE